MRNTIRLLFLSAAAILLLLGSGTLQSAVSQGSFGRQAADSDLSQAKVERSGPVRLSKALAADDLSNRGFEDDPVVLDPWVETAYWYVQTGTLSPLSSSAVPSPPEGLQAAMSDQDAAGSSILYQDVELLAPPADIELKFDLFVDNQHGDWIVPSTGTLVHSDTTNQHVRVDVMNPASAVNDVGAGVLMNIYRPVPGVDPTTFGYTEMTEDLSAFAGQTVRLRYAVVVTEDILLMGVDNVRLTQTPIVPMTPTLLTPLNGAVDIPLEGVALRFTEVAHATRYNVQVATDAAFSDIIFKTNVPGSPVQFIPPDPGTTYFWRAQAEGVHGKSPFSAPFHFSTVPGPPTLLTPLDGAVDIPLESVALRFTEVAHATRYNVQVATDAAFSDIIFKTNVPGSPVQFIPPDPGTTYFWRVQSEGMLLKSPFSAPFHFTTIKPIPDVPTLLTPLNGATEVPNTVNLRFTSEEWAIRYNVQVATDAAFTALVFSENVPQSPVTFVAPAPGLKYFWRVQAVGEFGNSEFSAPFNFTTEDQTPEVVTLKAPPFGAMDLESPVVLQWNAAANATQYLVQVSRDSLFADTLFSVITSDLQTEFVPPFAGETYFWRVQGIGPGGTSPGFSAVWKFSVAAEGLALAPTPVYPEDGATDVPVDLSFRWEAPAATTGEDLTLSKTSALEFFRVQVARDESFDDPVVDEDSILVDSLQVTGLRNGTEYFWRVAGVDEQGRFTFSLPSMFTTIVAVPRRVSLVSPSSGATGVSALPLFLWQAVGGAATYDLQVALDQDFSSLVIDEDGLTGTAFQTVTPLNYSTGHFWRVRAVNDAGPGEWSVIRSFTTVTGTAVDDDEIPASYALHDNYPNPFNPTTSIVVDLPQATTLTLTVFDVEGHEVMVLASGTVPAGRHTYTVEGSELASGIYLYRIESAKFTQTKRMVLLK